MSLNDLKCDDGIAIKIQLINQSMCRVYISICRVYDTAVMDDEKDHPGISTNDDDDDNDEDTNSAKVS